MPKPAEHSPPRVLILSASVGAGHVRAAQATQLAIERVRPDTTVRHVDVLTLTGALFRRVYAQAYLDLASHAPHVIGALYDATDRAPRAAKPLDRLQRLIERLNLAKLDALVREGWDAVVCTHFMPADLVSGIRRKRRLSFSLFTVVTDFDAHGLWAVDHIDHFFVAPRPWGEAHASLVRLGIDPRTISDPGIPIDPCFATPLTQKAARTTLNLPANRPCVLLLSGGFGVGPIEDTLRAIIAAPNIDRPFHLVAIAGKNAKLKLALERAAKLATDRVSCSVTGFTTDIASFMAAADLVITKPGGLTTSEVLARGVPMVIMNPIPGQESRNSDMLLEAGAAVKIHSPHAAGDKVTRLLNDETKLAAMRSAAKQIGRPNAAMDIAGAVLKHLESAAR